MRRSIWPVLLLLLLPFALRAAQLLRFEGDVIDDESVRLQWEVDGIQGLAGFELERSTDNVVYRSIGDRLTVQGLEYTFVDRPGLAGAPGEANRGARVDTEQAYYYRLWFVLPSGERVAASDQPIAVNFQMSTVSLTWGGIKAMFR